MALIAARIETAEMHVIGLVTGQALLVHPGRSKRVLVAAVTFGLPMLAGEGIGGGPVVIEECGLELFFDMAGFAFFSIAPLVAFFHVIPFMAGKTPAAQLFLQARPFVAAFAFHLFVFFPQDETGIPIVQERAGFESLFVMARFAFLAVAAFVAFFQIVFRMTGIASTLQLLVWGCGLMAAFTFCCAMFVAEGETGIPVMVEAGALPALCGMTGFALFAQAVLVNVILAVTIQAAGRRFLPVERALMATCTAYCPVSLQQAKAGIRIVLEYRLLPLVLLVACLATRSKCALMGVICAVA